MEENKANASVDLSKYDICLAVDKSTSMNEPVKAGSTRTRWQAAREETVGLATEAAKYDDDGITVCLFASKITKEYENISNGPEQANKIFDENSPGGSTNTAEVVTHYGNQYLARKAKGEAKPVILCIMTDGIPDSEPELVKAIITLSNKLDDRKEFGIQFIQVGNDTHAHDFLKRLDDNLTKEGAKHDIVDTKTFDELEEISIIDVLKDALTD